MPDIYEVVCPFCDRATQGFNPEAIMHTCAVKGGKPVVQRVEATGKWLNFLYELNWIRAENAITPKPPDLIDVNIF